MKTSICKHHILAVVSALLGVALSPAFSQTSEAFDWFAVSDSVRVFEDGYDCPPPQRAVDVFGIRGEVISAQVVIAAKQPLKNVTVRLDSLRPAAPGLSMSWNFVGSIPIPKNTPYAVKSRLSRPAPARFPDYLSEDHSMALAAGRYQSVWLKIRIPTAAPPGVYAASATLETDQGTASLPVRLTVYPLTMPEERHLNVSLWYNTRKFPQFHGINEQDSDQFWAMLKIYAETMADHRQNVFRNDFSNILVGRDQAGTLSFDFSRFDRWAETFWSTGGMNWMELGFIAGFGEGGFYSREIVYRDFRVQLGSQEIAMKGENVLPQLLPALEQHLRQKGWLEKSLLHIADEPTNWNVRSWRRISHQVHTWAPALRRMDAIEATDLGGELEVWVPQEKHLGTFFDVYKKAQAQGAELWYYSAMPQGNYPNRYVDYPLIEIRIMYWLNYRFGVSGFLHWGFNQWTADPFQIPLDEKYGAADGWIVYPKRDGLLSSVRYETMRAGLQDYEYLWLLQDKTAALKRRLGAGFEWIDPAQRGLELSARVIRDFGDYTRDPGTLYAMKEQVLKEILDLNRTPRVYVQTIPRDGTRLTYGPARIEVRGWTEPGTEILVAGKTIPVSEDGYFADAPMYYPQENVITINAKKGGAEKTLYRSFYSTP